MLKFLKHPGNLILIGFVIFATWMVYFSIKASQIPFDMAVEGDYFKLEKDFDNHIDAERNAKELGREFNFDTDGNKLTLYIPKELSSQLDNGFIEFFCLSDSKFDSKQILSRNNDGSYFFDRASVASGKNYIVKVTFSSNRKNYYKEFRML